MVSCRSTAASRTENGSGKCCGTLLASELPEVRLVAEAGIVERSGQILPRRVRVTIIGELLRALFRRHCRDAGEPSGIKAGAADRPA
jgi:hypothetical protein